MLVLELVLEFRFKSEVDFAALGTWGFESASLYLGQGAPVDDCAGTAVVYWRPWVVKGDDNFN